MLDEGTTSLSSQQLAEAKERLGASIDTGSSLDRSTVTHVGAVGKSWRRRSQLIGDIVKHPAFDPAELERVRTQRLTAIAQIQKDPNGIAQRVLPALLFGRKPSLCDAGRRRRGGDRPLHPR